MKQTLISKRNISILIILIFSSVCIVGVFLFINMKREDKPAVTKSNCEKQQTTECELLNESLSILPIDDRQELMKKQTKISDIEKYTNNANLMYIVTAYYIKIEDPDNSIKYYDLLKKAYAASGGYDAAIEPFAQAPDKMKLQIEYVSKLKESMQKNSITITEPQ